MSHRPAFENQCSGTIIFMTFVLKQKHANSSAFTVSLPPKGALPRLFPTVSLPFAVSSSPSRSLPAGLSPSYLSRFPLRSPCRRFRLAPSHRRLQAIYHLSVFRVVASVPVPPTELFPVPPTELFPGHFPQLSPLAASVSPSYFLRFPFRLLSSRSFARSFFRQCPVHSPCYRFRLARKGAHSKQFPTVSLPSINRVVASVPLPPNGALPKLFITVSCPFTLPSLPPGSFPTELSPSYLSQFPMLLELSPSYFPHFHARSPKLFPIRSPCRCSVSLPSKGAALKLLPTVSCPFTLSLRLSRSLSRELSPSYFRPSCPFTLRRFRVPGYFRRFPITDGVLSVHPVVASVWLPHRSSLRAIYHGFPSGHHLVGAPPKLLPTVSCSFPQLFRTVSLPFTVLALPSRSSRGKVN